MYSAAFGWNVFCLLSCSGLIWLRTMFLVVSLSGWSIHLCDGVLKVLYLLYCCLLLLLTLYLLYIFRHTNTYKCYILLLNWPIYHYVMPFFVSYCNICFKLYFVWYKYSYPSFFLVSICTKYLFHSFTFILCVSLHLKWVSCRQHKDGSCFLIHSVTLSLKNLVHLHLK